MATHAIHTSVVRRNLQQLQLSCTCPREQARSRNSSIIAPSGSNLFNGSLDRQADVARCSWLQQHRKGSCRRLSLEKVARAQRHVARTQLQSLTHGVAPARAPAQR